MSKKQTGKPSAAAAAKAEALQEAAKPVEPVQTTQTQPVAQDNPALTAAQKGAEGEVAQTSEFRNTYHESETAQDPEPIDGPVPPVTVAAQAQSQLPPDPEPDTEELLTVDNCTHFQNKSGRVFPATEVLRRLARRQDLKPVPAPK